MNKIYNFEITYKINKIIFPYYICFSGQVKNKYSIFYGQKVVFHYFFKHISDNKTKWTRVLIMNPIIDKNIMEQDAKKFVKCVKNIIENN